jgi:hypothetical protein
VNERPARRTSVRRPILAGLAKWSAVLVLGTIAWRTVRYALVFPMWGDEGMLAVNFFGRGFLELLQPLDYSQIAPPGFLWLELAASKLLGFSEPALRLAPFLAGITAVLLFWWACRKLLDRRAALMAIAVLAASFYPARHAAEVKPYSLDLLLAVAIILAAWAVYERPASTCRWAAFAAVASVSVWFSYPSVFVSGGACLWLLAYGSDRGARRRWGAVLVVGALISASFAAMYALAGSGQQAVAPASYWKAGFPPISAPWRIPLWALKIHTGMMLAYPNGGHAGGSTVSFLLAVAGGVVMWRNRRPLLFLLLSPLPLMFVAAALEKYPYGASARVSQHVAPAAIMLIGTGLVCVLRKVLGARRTIRFLPIAVLPFLAVVVGGIVRDIVHPYRSQGALGARAVIEQLSEQSRPEDRWVVYASRDRGTQVPYFGKFKGSGGRIHFQILSQAPVPVLWGPGPARIAELAGHRTWLIAYGNPVLEPGREELDAYARQLATILGEAVTVRRHALSGREWIEVVRFGGRRSAPVSGSPSLPAEGPPTRPDPEPSAPPFAAR